MLLVLLASAVAFAPARPGTAVVVAKNTIGGVRTVSMKTWSRRKTLADQIGGVEEAGAQNVGLVGTVPVEFCEGEVTLRTMAIPGQPLSEVASQAGQFIPYKCRKGQCGTCQVRVDGQWIKTCQTRVPPAGPAAKGAEVEPFRVEVRAGSAAIKASSRFFSLRSFVSGFRNNLLGMVGFVRERRRARREFQERIAEEDRIKELAAAKRAQRQAMGGN